MTPKELISRLLNAMGHQLLIGPTIDYLISQNEPLSTEQRSSISSRLAWLEAEFVRITGQTYNTEGLSKLALEAGAGRMCFDAVCKHRYILSIFRTLPIETLQHIFEFVVWPPGHDMDQEDEEIEALQTLCAVSRQWRGAAIAHCPLWTHVPDFDADSDLNLWDDGDDDDENPSPNIAAGVKLIQRHTDRLRIWLSRSGSLPITTMWQGYRSLAIPEWESMISQDLKLLASESHRWGSVALCVPPEYHQDLASVVGRLPLLHTLSLSIGTNFQDEPPPGPFNVFSEAPALRSLALSAENASLSLPWNQLVSVQIVEHPQAYKLLVETQPEHLATLDVTSSSSQTSYPTFPVNLPQLQTLVFTLTGGGFTHAFANHLDNLTLPSLQGLQIHDFSRINDPPAPTNLAVKVLRLIRRSKFPLRDIELSTSIGLDNPDSSAIFDAFALCPTLERVSVTHLDANGLRRLILDPSSPDSMLLPMLKNLTFAAGTPVDTLIHVLMDMVKSRTLPPPPDRGMMAFAPTLRVVMATEGFAVSEFHSAIVDWETKELADRFVTSPAPNGASFTEHFLAGETLFEFLEAAEKLLSIEQWKCATSNNPTELALYHYDRCSEILSKLEGFDVDNTNTAVLVRTEIPRALHRFVETEEDWKKFERVAPDLHQSTRARAIILLDRWKPSLLRDQRAYPYRCTYARLTATPSYFLVSSSRKPISDDEMWRKHILGLSD